jgi:uncharacterized protein (DUF1800 family)
VIYLAVIYALTLAMGGLLVRGLLAGRERAEAAWQQERASLLQRIQAPGHAVIEHHNQEPVVAPPAVSEFDDEDFWESREALADRLAAAEVNGNGDG